MLTSPKRSGRGGGANPKARSARGLVPVVKAKAGGTVTPAAKAKAKAKAVTKPKPGARPIAKAVAKPTPGARPIAKAVAKAVAKPKPKAKAVAKLKPGARPIAKAVAKAVAKPSAKAVAKPKPIAEPAAKSKPIATTKPSAKAKPSAPLPPLPPLPSIIGVSSPAQGRARLMVDGARFGDATLALLPLPALHLASGVVVACDPFEVVGPPLAREAPHGRHEAVAAVATYPRKRGPGAQRLAAIIVRFADTIPSRWEPATFADDPGAIDPAYVSATGAGCLMDGRVQAILAAEPSSWPTASYRALERQLLTEHLAQTWGWASYSPDPAAPDNCLAFLSTGGAVRRSYWGLDDHGSVVCLLTDLEALPAEAWVS